MQLQRCAGYSHRHRLTLLARVLAVLVFAGAGWIGFGLVQRIRLGPALLAAVRNRDATTVSKLLDWGADSNFRVDMTEHPTSLWEFIISLWRRIAERRSKLGKTALMLAAENRDVECIRLLLAHGANVNLRDGDGRTALLDAAAVTSESEIDEGSHGASERTLRLLLDSGADVNAQDAKGMTALMYLFLSTMEQTAAGERLLLDHGADVNRRNNRGETAIFYAVEAQQYRGDASRSHLVGPLLAHGANTNVLTNERVSLLMSSALNGDNEITDMLLRKGADPNAQDTKGTSVLMYACSANQTPLVDFSLAGSREYGMFATALSHADSDTISLLLRSGAHVNARDRKGRTALMYAARPHFVDAVKLLLHHGANVNARDTEGRTALGWSLSYNSSLRAMLKRAGAKY